MISLQQIVTCVCMMTVLALVMPSAGAQSTAFTYQGHLTNGALPANGQHDFRFRLFDAAEGEAQIGPAVCFDGVVVVNGVFNVLLDFGDQFVTTDTRHLEIHVRQEIGQPCTDDIGYVLLSPRQPLTAAPQASHARSAFALAAPDGSPADAVIVDNDGNVGIGTSAPAFKLDVRGGPMLVQNLGDQADLLWLASDRTWVFRQEGTGASTALKLQSVGGGGNKNFIIQTDGNVGINTISPQAKLDVRGDIRLGSSGQFLAPAGDENLRIIRGIVSPTGEILMGSGYQVSHPSTGNYLITFTTAFAGMPTIVGNVETVLGNRVILISSVSSSSALIVVSRADEPGPVEIDEKFHFTAIGGR